MVPTPGWICEIQYRSSLTRPLEQGEIYVSSGKIGRSVQLNAEDLANLVHQFAGLSKPIMKVIVGTPWWAGFCDKAN